jgi:hypothetical protein
MDLLTRIILYNQDLYKFISNKNEGYLHYVLASNVPLLYTSKFNFLVFVMDPYLPDDIFHTYLIITPSGMAKFDKTIYTVSSVIRNNELSVGTGGIFIKHNIMDPFLLKWPITRKRGRYTLDEMKHFIIVYYDI